jgi:hypothetical protein
LAGLPVKTLRRKDPGPDIYFFVKATRIYGRRPELPMDIWRAFAQSMLADL